MDVSPDPPLTTFSWGDRLPTVDAPRVRGVVRPGPDARPVAALGAALTLAGATALAMAAEPLLEAVSISPATWRIATGLLLVATGLLAVGGPGPGPEPALAGRIEYLAIFLWRCDRHALSSGPVPMVRASTGLRSIRGSDSLSEPRSRKLSPRWHRQR